MSMNQYMHPRNIYRQPPNFKQLALEYPEFRKHVVQDISGKVTINFKDINSLRALSCTLLKKDFGLDVRIPSNKLIPTIPLRLNYILWLEDLLTLLKLNDNDIRGIDIGTGASCVYPLLAARKNRWSMLATEIDPESIKSAQENIERNNLQDLITVFTATKSNLLVSALEEQPSNYDFCMCNPPFFSSAQELHPFFKSRKLNRAHPKNAFCASVDEVVSKGGEVEYITGLINESQVLKSRIKVFSTMVGHKCNLPVLKKRLREVEVVSFKQTEFCQGHTTRWGLAWTFEFVDLTRIPDLRERVDKPLFYEVPKIEGLPYKLSFVNERLLKVFEELEVTRQEVKHVNNLIEYVVVALANTWSHQRRKRREKLRLSGCDETKNNNNVEGSSGGELGSACEKLAQLSCNGSSSVKRRLEEESDCAKKVKTDVDEFVSDKVYLKAKISIIKAESSIGLELTFFEGKGQKEGLHQILQYIKNNLMKE